jgi:Domain of unknown function (DUF4340)
MKLQRNAFGLVVAAVLLAGVVAVSEGQRKSSNPASGVDQATAQKLFDFAEGAIALVTIETRRPASKPTPIASPAPEAAPTASPTASPAPSPALLTTAMTIERVDGKWQLSAPLKVPANESTVAFLTNLLTTTQRDRTITISPDRAAEFGLDQPTATIAITLTDQTKHRLILGKPSFDRTFMYAQIDPDPNAKELAVALISPQFANAVDRELKEWQVEKKSEQPSVQPTAQPTASPSPSPTASPSASPSPAVTPSPETSPQPEASLTPKP